MTEKRDMGFDLRARPSLLESILSNARDAVLVTEARPIDEPGPKIVYVNEAFTNTTGYTAEEVVGETPRILQGSGTSRAQLDKIRAALTRKEAVRVELLNYHKDGAEFWVEVDIVPVTDEHGNHTHWVSVQREVTERRRQQEALRESEERLHTILVQYSSDLITILEPDSTIRFQSPSVEALGYLPEDVAGKSIFDYIHPEDIEQVTETLAEILDDTGTVSPTEVRVRHADGSWRYIEAIGNNLLDDPRVHGVVVNSRDVTGRRQVQDALRESEESYRSMVSSLKEVIFRTDAEGRYTFLNPAWEDVTGFTVEESLGKSYLEFIHPEDLQRNPEDFEQMGNHEGDYTGYQARFQAKDGSPREVEIQFRERFDEKGNLTSTSGTLDDITERKKAERDLQESEQRFRQLFNQSVDLLLIHDENGNIVDCNPEACRAHGYTRQEMLSLSIRDLTDNLLSEEELQARKRAGGTLWQRAVAGDLGTSDTFHLGKHKRKDGTTFPVEVLVGSVNCAGRRLILASVRDTTERKRAEEELRESEERYRSLVELSPDAIVVHSAGEIVYINSAGAALFGADGSEELIGRKFLDLVHPDYREIIQARIKRVLETGEPAPLLEEKYFRLDGSLVDVEVAGTAINYLGKPSIQIVLRDITGRKRIEEALKESEERFRAIFEGSGVGISIADPDRKLLETNPAYQEMTGYSEEELFGKPIAELSHSQDVPKDAELNHELLSGELDQYPREKRYTRKDGEVIWVKPTVSAVRDAEDEPRFLVGVVEDITERKQAEISLRESEERFRQLFEHSVDLLFVHDGEGRIFQCNTEACRALGYTREELLDFTVGDIAAKLLTKEEGESQEEAALWERALSSEPGGIVGFEQNELRRKDGTTFPVEIGVGSIDYEGRRMIFASARDITRHKELEAQLTYQAFHDTLTHLPNRALFLERLEHALVRLSRSKSGIAVLFMDLDNFKVINDSLGHEMGDRLLHAASERLGSGLRPEDTLARFGGDEFTMLLENINNVEEAKRVAERISEAFGAPFEIQQQQVFTNVSIGIAVGNSSQEDPEDLLRNADAAMYEAKRNGKAQYMVFEPGMTLRLQERLDLENELRRGIENNEFVVHYQPEVFLETGEVFGFEALVRWEHPSRGLIPPKQFLPVAEETGLILHIEQRVLEDSCHHIRKWREQYSSSLVVSVNLYQKQLQQPDLTEQIARQLREANLAPHNLMLEITEEVVMQDEKSILEALQALKDQGIRLAIDDFGTGYSSLDYLKRLPVDYVKIDRSFVERLEEDHKDQVIVSAAISLAHALDLKVIAEGVETSDQLKRLRELGCDLAQGYYFAKALTKDKVPAFLASRSSRNWK